jgi:hypothetical protein
MSAFNAMRVLGWDPKDDPQSAIVQAKRAGYEVDLGDDEGVVHVRNEDEANRLRGTLAVLRAQAAGAAKAPAKRTAAAKDGQ